MIQTEHVTATGGMLAYFGKDIVDGWPLGPVGLAFNQTFYYDPHQDNFQRLWFVANAAKWASGAATPASAVYVPPASGGVSVSGVKTFPYGEQNRWTRDGSGLPYQEQN
jgi:hypothetical protein